MSVHGSHPDIVKRLNRAAGHLGKVVSMIEGGAPCLQIAQQLQAVVSALQTAKTTLIHDHLDHCLHHALEQGGAPAKKFDAAREFKEITKYL
jgi:DNA-binding FrmR family transcriptional regulator